MNEQYQKLYSNLNRNEYLLLRSNKYLPIQKQTINYESMFDVTNNIKSVRMKFNTNNVKKKEKSLSRHRDGNDKIGLNILEKSRESNYREDMDKAALKYIQLAYNINKKRTQSNKCANNNNNMNNKRDYNHSTIKNNDNKIDRDNSIMILNNAQDENDYEDNYDDNEQNIVKNNQNFKQQQIQLKERERQVIVDDDRLKKQFKKIDKQKFYQKHHRTASNSKINQDQLNEQKQQKQQKLQVLIDNENLDLYIDQYINHLKINQHEIKQTIQNNRQKFIEQAIINIKQKIISDIKNKQDDNIYDLDKKNNVKMIKEIKSKDNQERKRKRNSKSMSNVANNQKNLYQLPQLPKRQIYEKSSNSLAKVGKTYYFNELNLLQQTLALQAKNRQRAQRVFKRKLMNLQKNSFSLRQKYHSEQLFQYY